MAWIEFWKDSSLGSWLSGLVLLSYSLEYSNCNSCQDPKPSQLIEINIFPINRMDTDIQTWQWGSAFHNTQHPNSCRGNKYRPVKLNNGFCSWTHTYIASRRYSCQPKSSCIVSWKKVFVCLEWKIHGPTIDWLNDLGKGLLLSTISLQKYRLQQNKGTVHFDSGVPGSFIYHFWREPQKAFVNWYLNQNWIVLLYCYCK